MKTRPLNVAVFGLGYVGSVTAACLASVGHCVTGVDVNAQKVSTLNSGQCPVVEPGLPERLKQAVGSGNLRATTDYAEAMRNADISLVCVGTPGDRNGGLDYTYLRHVIAQIGAALRGSDRYHVVVVRSTMLPGSAESIILPLLVQESGKHAGEHFGFCVNPEFLREGTGLADFEKPPFTLIGEHDERSGDVAAALYPTIDAQLLRTNVRTAEMVKYVSNTWHALKISFANEIGNLCKAMSIDSHEIMDIFTRDTKLNVSAAYLKPGFAFGGSCLPKDLRALLHTARSEHLRLPVLDAILPSNELQWRKGVDMVLATGKRRVGVLGFSFKENTDDLRESPMLTLIEALIGKGLDVQVCDPDVALSQVIGANRRYLEESIPHIASILNNDLDDVIERSEVVVIGKKSRHFREAVASAPGHRHVIDLVRLFDGPPNSAVAYDGICW